MKINVFKKAFHSFLLVASLTFGCFQLSSCSSNNDDKLSDLDHFWEEVSGLPASELSKVEFANLSQVEYLSLDNKDYTKKPVAYVFSGIKNNKLWLSAYETEVQNESYSEKKNSYRKILEWNDSKNFITDKRTDKYTTISINNIYCNSLVFKKDGFAFSMTYTGDTQNSSYGRSSEVTITKFIKNGVVKDSIGLKLKDLTSWYGDYFVNNSNLGYGEIINIDGSTPHIFICLLCPYWELVTMDEFIDRSSLFRAKVCIEQKKSQMGVKEIYYEIIGYNKIWEIKDEDVAKKLNIKLGEKDKISYELLKKVDEHTWKYKVHVVYDDWDTPDADYEILVDIDKGELK